MNFSANHQPVLLYWLYLELGANFPAGQLMLPHTGYVPFSTAAPDLAVFSTRSSDGSVSVLLSYGMAASAAD